MKPKKSIRKLSLNKQTVSHLDRKSLMGLNGGASNVVDNVPVIDDFTGHCPSLDGNDICSSYLVYGNLCGDPTYYNDCTQETCISPYCPNDGS